MKCFLVAGDVPAEYVPMLLEEMEIDGKDVRAFHWDRPVAESAKKAFHVLVIGCGMSGVLAAIRLEEAGLPYTVIEKNPAAGGTWYENHYPGCRVDVGNHFFCYSFEPNNEWTEFFARQPELQRYFEACIAKYGIRDKIRFETEVVAATYDESSHPGASACAAKTDAKRRSPPTQSSARSASSTGRSCQHSRYRDLSRPMDALGTVEERCRVPGKRVAVIGTGASAFVTTKADELAVPALIEFFHELCNQIRLKK